jgi:hypothetical protein
VLPPELVWGVVAACPAAVGWAAWVGFAAAAGALVAAGGLAVEVQPAPTLTIRSSRLTAVFFTSTTLLGSVDPS